MARVKLTFDADFAVTALQAAKDADALIETDTRVSGTVSDVLIDGGLHDVLFDFRGSNFLDDDPSNIIVNSALVDTDIGMFKISEIEETAKNIFDALDADGLEGLADITLGVNDVIVGGALADDLPGLSGNDLMKGRRGDDTLDGGTGDDHLIGGTGGDKLEGGAGNDTLVGRAGSDDMEGGDDNDLMFGNRAGDEMHGGAGDDTMEGNKGDDLLSGDSDNDDLMGNGGDDDLIGGAGNDFLRGNSGSDTLIGGTGDDTLKGGNDADTLIFNDGDGNDMILGFEVNGAVGALGEEIAPEFTIISTADRLDVTDVAALNGFSAVLSSATETDGSTTIDYGTGSFTLVNIALAELSASDFIFGTG